MEKYAFFLTDHISFVFLTFYFVLGYSQLGFPWWLSSKESAYDAEDAECPRFDPWIGKIPWRRAWQSTPVLLPGESHRQRSLAGYSPWACEESDTTEVTNTHSQLTGNVVIVSGEQQRVSAIHAHICILPQTLLPFLEDWGESWKFLTSYLDLVFPVTSPIQGSFRSPSRVISLNKRCS